MDSTLNDVGTVAVACDILQWQSREADPLSDQDDAATSSKRTPAHVASPSHRAPAVGNSASVCVRLWGYGNRRFGRLESGKGGGACSLVSQRET